LILLSAELFTNAVEWFGKRLRLSEGAVGSVVAAVGTALPETSISIVAVIVGTEHAQEVGIGAILGAPMMLATLAMFVTGAAVIYFHLRRKRPIDMRVNYEVIGRDLRTFFIVYAVAIAASLLPFKWMKITVGVLLILAYFFYVQQTFKRSDERAKKHTHKSHHEEEEEDLKPLHFHRNAISPQLRRILIQIFAGVALMITGAKLFLDSITTLAPVIGIPGLVLSVIIAPVATELPEKFNSVTWVRNRKDTLALGNISGAMVFQSSMTPAIGLFFTSWVLEPAALASGVIALAAAGIIGGEMMLRKRISPYSLLIGGILYAVFPIYYFCFLK
jgi:cation:H+ antiporter